MSTPSLRILIVDTQHWRRLSIEKMLNQQGYYRIAPVASFEDLLTIVESAIEPFDLMVINSELFAGTRFNCNVFCLHCPNIRHVLMYDEQPVVVQTMGGAYSSKVVRQLTSMPDVESIKNFMKVVDPPSREAMRHLYCGIFSERHLVYPKQTE